MKEEKQILHTTDSGEANLRGDKMQALFRVRMTKESFVNDYTLKARIGMRISQLFGIIELDLY
jgi:hypothetical protein